MKSLSQPRGFSGALLAASAVLTFSVLILIGCGDVYRPVANPEPAPAGDPQSQHLALVLNNNGGGIGSTTEVNVAGDSNVGNFTVGRNPVHATYISSFFKAAVVNKGDDTLSTYAPNVQGSAVITTTLPAGAAPVFVSGVAGGNMYVAGSNPGACGNVATVFGCVYVVNGTTNTMTTSLAVGKNPVALAETPDGSHVYAINQGENSVTRITTADLSVSAPLAVGSSPTWATTSADSATLYVANTGDNSVSVIDIASNSVVATLTNVGTGPRFLVYDAHLRRLYVANTGGSSIRVFNADVNPPVPLGTVTVGANPTSLTPLADGTRIYVANAGCQDRLDLTTPCTGNTVSVVDAVNLTVRKTIPVGTGPVFLDSSPDSSRVDVANRDSSTISCIRTSDDTVVNTLPSGSPNPIFVSIR